MFDLLLNSCVRTQVSNEERECLTCCKTAASGLRSVMRRERVFDLLLTAASGLWSVMRRETVFDLL